MWAGTCAAKFGYQPTKPIGQVDELMDYTFIYVIPIFLSKASYIDSRRYILLFIR